MSAGETASTAEAQGDGDTRERILREATRLFATHGTEGTSLRMIAEAVGMQKGSLVYHFSTKSGLHEAVMDDLFARWQEILPRIMLAAATDGRNRFEAVMAECLTFFAQDPNRARLLLRHCLDHPEELRQRLASGLAPWLALVAQRIQAGQAEDLIHADVDPAAYITHVVVMALGSTAVAEVAPGLLGPHMPARDAARRLNEELLRVAYRGLFKAPREEPAPPARGRKKPEAPK